MQSVAIAWLSLLCARPLMYRQHDCFAATSEQICPITNLILLTQTWLKSCSFPIAVTGTYIQI